jgi:uncharacterized protein (DUF1015 family)
VTSVKTRGLSLAPFRALRYTAGPDRLDRLLCPPYDVIDDAERARLLAGDPDNAVSIILPRAEPPADPYRAATDRLAGWIASGTMATDPSAALYVYELMPVGGTATRGLLGAVELRDPDDGVILPHEDTMAGPVADRLALMTATEANLEPIYLVYDGGGAASELVRSVGAEQPQAQAVTADGTTHRLWAVTDRAAHAAIDDDLADRHALIADGHHRYATYREMQRRYRGERGPGPWDRGLTLLVDTSSYGPQVQAIHRVLTSLPLTVAVDAVRGWCAVRDTSSPDAALAEASQFDGFAAVLTDGRAAFLITDADGRLRARSLMLDERRGALADLDVTVLHHVLVPEIWRVPDRVEVVGYAHDIDEAITAAQRTNGTAILLRPTPVSAVAAVAAAGARMPRKSTLFVPKPASGLVMRRFADEP